MKKDGVLIEIRSAAGGEEAKIWADDLLRMYLKLAQIKSWPVSILGKGVLRINIPEAYDLLGFEAGVHRVQRVPLTEKRGRIHTSTATVAVLPIIPETEIQINPADLEWQFYRASSQGGQNVQKVSTAVRLIHRPTGIVVTSERERFQEQNRRIALEVLRSKLWEKKENQRVLQIDSLRREAVGHGMRSEKIRTYNYPQNRVTDHRINKKFRLEDIIEGKLEKMLSLLASG